MTPPCDASGCVAAATWILSHVDPGDVHGAVILALCDVHRDQLVATFEDPDASTGVPAW